MRTVYWLLTKVRVQKPKMLREREREREKRSTKDILSKSKSWWINLYAIFYLSTYLHFYLNLSKAKSINSTFYTYLIHFDTFLVLLKILDIICVNFSKKSNHLSRWNWYWNNLIFSINIYQVFREIFR